MIMADPAASPPRNGVDGDDATSASPSEARKEDETVEDLDASASASASASERDSTQSKLLPTGTGKSKRTAKRGRTGKKPADMPRRPLSAYNFFFSDQRSQIMAEQSKVKDEKRDIFTTLGRIVADRWKKLDDKGKVKYNELATKDLLRYRREMERYNENIARKNRQRAEQLKPSSEEDVSKSTPRKLPSSCFGHEVELASAVPAQHAVSQMQMGMGGHFPGAAAAVTGLAGISSSYTPTRSTWYGGAPGAPALPPSLLGLNLERPGNLSQYISILPSLQQQLERERLELIQHQNHRLALDQIRLARPHVPVPPSVDQVPRVHIFYPPNIRPGTERSPESATIQIHPPGAHSITSSTLDAASLLAPRATEASMLTNLLPPQFHQTVVTGPASLSLLDQLHHQQQHRQDESVRQVYARLLLQQQQQRQARQRDFPYSEDPRDRHYPY